METYIFNWSERKRRIAIEEADGPRALIVLLTPDPRSNIGREHVSRVQTPNRPQNDKREQEIRKS